MKNKKRLIWISLGILSLCCVIISINILSQCRPLWLQGFVVCRQYRASSKLAGRILEMRVQEGDTVTKGEVLYILSTPELDARFRQAQAVHEIAQAVDQKVDAGLRRQQIASAKSMWEQALAGERFAQRSYQRIEKLYSEGVVPAQKRDEALAKYQAATAQSTATEQRYLEAQAGARIEDRTAAKARVAQTEEGVDEIRSMLRDASVLSPISGEVSTVAAYEGELIGSGTPAVMLLDTADQWVEFNVKETMLHKFSVGQHLEAYVPSLLCNVELEVYSIAAAAEFATWQATRSEGAFDIRTFEIRMRPLGMKLRSGMSVLINSKSLESC